ncbi:uncharacterized protein FIBRA_06372 [Fibroporia radiculosa]|uniref:DNA replication regulator SLD2 n=1 Tax=Fibroporia radiculosa TaxID=599839 RepID=J4IB82_9APHY|nr:uncharacterized protein FIBRA_06372 [Fibroporia radiculosa]CCM04206.1 predicted protein [Fibroporia radiculosa]
MDVASLRAEIKAWEREFRGMHSRNPSIQEIKDQPAIAAKYKLYKSLSKSSVYAPIVGPSTSRSSTPPGSQPRQTAPASTSLFAKSRAVKVDPPSQTSNPFSPVKNKDKSRDIRDHGTVQSVKPSSDLNPFTTPTKPKQHINFQPLAQSRSPSPEPFPLIQTVRPSSPVLHTPTARSAVTRARKRLRGEPVSPSPVKDKRVRADYQRSLNFTSSTYDSDDDVSHENGHLVANGSETFMEATPMKLPPGGKAFRLLFDEVLPASQEASRQPASRALSRNRPPVDSKRFSNRRKRSRAFSPSSGEDEDGDWSRSGKLKGLMTSITVRPTAEDTNIHEKLSNQRGSKRILPRAVLPPKDDLRSDVGPSRGQGPKHKVNAALGDRISISQPGRSAVKRPLGSELQTRGSDELDSLMAGKNFSHRLPLLPPSPPAESSRSYASNSKDPSRNKAASAFSRKKARLLEHAGGDESDHGDEKSDADDGPVKIVEHSWHSRKAQCVKAGGEPVDDYFDWSHSTPRLASPVSRELAAEAGTIDVQLPDELKRILALSLSQDADKEQKRLVNGLLYGRRQIHYDPKKGEIWDIGEVDDSTDDIAKDSEEDWESEPIPWEIGEL